ncbi:MAG TPA: UDP-glucose/GDP-mannose dehydrogenase family protein [Blastocatellia bacterium]|nr:UDP-glucose/GDP-mannose dehydrogenase family protein [Blastocatellia bacterium]
MQISVIGTGYVGLVTGACFADFGNNVTCVDKDEDKIGLLRDGEMPIYEPGLEAIVSKNVREGRLHFTTDIADAIGKSLVVFLAVGTPSSEDGSADMTQVQEVAHRVAECLNGYKVIVTKSTVPVGAAAMIKQIIEKNKSGPHRFSVAANPEFLREGAAIRDFLRPDRVVIGCDDEEAIAILKDLFRPLYLIDAPFVITNPKSAEMVKYASNAFLAAKVSFINEIANLCDLLGADVGDVAKGMGLDRRIGPEFLHPGPGYGGSCFPKDARALAALGRGVGYQMKLVNAIIGVNELQKDACLDRIRRLIPDPEGKTIAVLGLSFKPETDDMREAPSIPIIQRLLEMGGKIKAFDPVAVANARRLLPQVEYCEDEYAAAEGSNALIVMTEWNQFRNLDLQRLKSIMREANLVDLRNIYEPKTVRAAGFNFVSVGRNA